MLNCNQILILNHEFDVLYVTGSGVVENHDKNKRFKFLNN